MSDEMSGERSGSSRLVFNAAANGFVEMASRVPPGAWERPALGVWSVRDLVGHASRALSTIESYLGQAPSGTNLGGPVDYFVAARAGFADPEAIALRGRQAGAALGEDPARAVSDLAQRVMALVEGTADETPVATAGGHGMTLAGYLPTRTFELTVHTLDLARALDLEPPGSLAPAVTACCELAGQLAGRHPHAAQLLLALTGRPGLDPGLSVL